ncbi:monoheme cytochrome SoxX (sulfur oxidation) [Pseudaminobacter salicylatoxidans]|uniref:Monoheme cytochrome SoxX (Sulfur oxidation) n=1 Tax=Pseudaminobacter salicylatoxidans TaxID=93369 RepID=A0A316C8X2_PSESE|nr:sulfur oxidation c-type cytochrome SoxX [Pseudaminobacter salicylatoxidans]PWJ84467.1 monoheme cytochrome SoxX (sulfur oxidation) [Pseudaminobacter salicylatoxidans]
MKPGVWGSAAVALLVANMAYAAEVAPNDVKVEDGTVAQSLTGNPGDPEMGAKALANRGLGNCLACHAVSALESEQFHGDVAPPLDGVADRWQPEQLRAIVVDAKKVFGPESVMPGFYSLEVGINVRKDLVGKPILTAQQVEDVVAYLSTLKEGD